MSYNFYMQHIQQLIAMGLYNGPVNVPTHPLWPYYLPVPNLQVVDAMAWNENVNEESESDGEHDDDVDERTLFCANLHQNVSDAMLYELFLQAGPIQKVHIPKDNHGKSRLFGFITYKYRSCPQYALRLFQGIALFGRTLDIKLQGRYNLNRRK